MYFLKILLFLLFFGPTVILVGMGIKERRVHVNAIYAVSIYTLAWGLFWLVMTLTQHMDSRLGAWLMTLSCIIAGGSLIASTRDIRLAKLSAVIAIAATVLLPLTLN